MKHTYIFTIIVLLCSCIQEQLTSFPESNSADERTIKNDSYYWYLGEKIPLYETSDKVFAIFDKSSIGELYDPITRSTSTRSFTTKPYHTSKRILNIDVHPEHIIWAKVDKDLVIANASNVIYYAPYFRTETGKEIGVTNYFLIQLKSSNDSELLEQFALDNNVTIVDRNERTLWNTLACGTLATGNALQLANKAYESGLFSATDIVFENDIKIDSENPNYNDLYFSQQWNLTGTYGINLKNTHSITTGHPNIKVAVIDNGFQLDHPDMPILSSNSWDATTQSSPAKQYLYNGKTYNNHGTGVASIIGADVNNEIGIAGIAPDVTLLPISVDFSISTTDTTSHNPLTSLCNAIDHAVSSGVDIINNSWSYHALHPALNDMIEQALDNGRNGNGCVVVFASGNDGSEVTKYPAGSNDDTIIVGGTDTTGNRRTSSNYSEKLDLVAPGGDIPILADKGTEDYESGTSFAAPHVTGVAALMLSVNPSLTRDQVTEILKESATKVPKHSTATATDSLYGLWHEEVGYGIVNCYNAVVKAISEFEIERCLSLIEFDYSGTEISLSLTSSKNLVILWDDEDEMDYSFVPHGSTVNLNHTYSTSANKHITIAEYLSDGSTVTSSTALTRFELTTGNNASNIDIKSINSALEDIKIIGGANFALQNITLDGLNALKELYLIQLKNAAVTVKNCGALTTLATSRHIWYHRDFNMLEQIDTETLNPYVVGDGASDEWPAVPEVQSSLMTLSITNCPLISTLSLENVGFINFSFNGLNNLSYVYLSSQSNRIVGAGNNYTNPSTYGYYLSSAISSLPSRSSFAKGKIVIRAVNNSNTEFIPVSISPIQRDTIQNHCEDKSWTLVWDSGIN